MESIPTKKHIAGSSNGRTADFESVNLGSIPSPAALRQAQCEHFSEPSASTFGEFASQSNNMAQMWFVYMLLCDQKTFYIGITPDIERRLSEHRSKTSFFTKKFSDLQVVYSEKYPSKHDAAIRERQLKGWSRAKKQLLNNGTLGYNRTESDGVPGV